MLCPIAESAWLDTEQQQGTSVVVKLRSSQLLHEGHDMLGQPSCTSPRPDAELDRLFVNKFLLPQQPTHQQAESSLEADDILAAEATDMNEYTTSDLSVLSEPPNHNDVSHSRDCDLHALFSGRDDAFPKQARSHMFAQACSDPWLDQMVRYSRD